jgi:endonuclease/exonuclease/phosphatase family metal-dependent hydrolase
LTTREHQNHVAGRAAAAPGAFEVGRTLCAEPFRPFLQELARFETTKELEESNLYRKLRSEIERVLNYVWAEEYSNCPPFKGDAAKRQGVHAVAWNIERGIRIDGIAHTLLHHPELRDADVLLLSELDWGMARTNNRFIARDLASTLGMNYAFAPCYVALTKGAGVEKNVAGENVESLHGNALLSRHPMRNVHSIPLPNGKDKMKGAEKRIGSQRAVIADVDHPLGAFRAVSLHLDAHSSQRHRYLQMKRILSHLDSLKPQLPVLIGGDWNTTTHDASRALFSILGYFRRVLMGVRHVVARHYPYPERWFERRLFAELERGGYDYRGLNTPGECTLHYNVRDIATNLNMAEWVPHWCFWFINWALERTGGRCSMKLDWFAAKGIQAAKPAVVVHGLNDEGRPISDHDPIALCFTIPRL